MNDNNILNKYLKEQWLVCGTLRRRNNNAVSKLNNN
jgi:hypothetical protein